MKKKVKLAFELLEKEMEVISFQEQKNYLGGATSSGFPTTMDEFVAYFRSLYGEPQTDNNGNAYWSVSTGGYADDGSTWAGDEVTVVGFRKTKIIRKNWIDDFMAKIVNDSDSSGNNTDVSGGSSGQLASTGNREFTSTGQTFQFLNNYLDQRWQEESYYDEKEQVVPPEQKWAILHPIAALQANKNKESAFILSFNLPGVHNGYGDAFRHAYWMAANARDFGGNLAIESGMAMKILLSVQ